MSAIDNFRGAMSMAGLNYGGPIAANGKLHRFKSEGDHKLNSWYVLHDGQPAGGAFGCFKRGISETWSEREFKAMPAPERQRMNERLQAAKAESERVKQDRHTEARDTAAAVLGEAKATQAHAYLIRKAVQAYGDLREHKGRIVLPLRDADGTLHSLQFIGVDGDKKFLTGGRVAGTFFAICAREDGPLIICEGFATGASIHEATGYATVAAMSSGNLLAVAQALRNRWPAREIIICGDDDAWTDRNPGRTAATTAAATIGARMAVPTFVEVTTKPTDFNDLHRLEGIDAVKTQIDAATQTKETDEQCIARLAKLRPFEYARVRTDEAKRMGVGVPVLDGAVAPIRKQPDASGGQGRALTFADPEPWHEPVNGVELLTGLAMIYKRHAILPPGGADYLALWTLGTYVVDLFDYQTIAHVVAPERECGKSRVRDVAAHVVHRRLSADSSTPAYLFRVIEQYRPTLLLDEFDNQDLEGRKEILAILNGGYHKDGSVGRIVGDNHEPRNFSTYCPKMLVSIGDPLPDATKSRAVRIPMRRKLLDETVETLRGVEYKHLQRQCVRWVADNCERLKLARPVAIAELSDRQKDVTEPLLALADVAGGEWPGRGRSALRNLLLDNKVETTSIGPLLLMDIKSAFEGRDRISTDQLLGRLNDMDERPWPTYRQGRPLNPRQLSAMLEKYSISSRSVRIASDQTLKGFFFDDFADAFKRYTGDSRDSIRHNGTTAGAIADSLLFRSGTDAACAGNENDVLINVNGPCAVVPADMATNTTRKVEYV